MSFNVQKVSAFNRKWFEQALSRLCSWKSSVSMEKLDHTIKKKSIKKAYIYKKYELSIDFAACTSWRWLTLNFAPLSLLIALIHFLSNAGSRGNWWNEIPSRQVDRLVLHKGTQQWSLFTMAITTNLDYTFSLVLVTKIRDVNSTWPLCDKGE